MSNPSSEKFTIDSEFQDIWINADKAREIYGTNTLGLVWQIAGAFMPRSVDEIKKVIRWANSGKHSLYVFSTGKNWGYGSASPNQDNYFLVDLSRMNRVLYHNEELGLITLEPGVTQEILFQFLKNKNSKLIVPTTGAGPEASILGNALDKGVGLTPIEDHYSALMSLEAVMADGSIYKSTLSAFGGSLSDSIFKWKSGPILEGLFAQSNIGIVTQATFVLAKMPEKIEQFFALVDHKDLKDVTNSIRVIRQTLGTAVGGINLMDQRRVLALMDVNNTWPKNRPATLEELQEWRRQNGLKDFVLIGALYGTHDIVNAAKKFVKKQLNGKASELTFLNKHKIEKIKSLLKWLPSKRLASNYNKKLLAAERGFEILEGKPSYFALRLAYLKNQNAFEVFAKPDPDINQCGLIWFAPLLPIEPEIVFRFNQRVTEICLQHGFDPIITFIAISERCFDCTMPILFDKSKPDEIARAIRCRDELFKMAVELKVFPHRMDTDVAKKYFRSELSTAVSMHKKIKSVLDPNGIFAPGRFSEE